MSGRLNSRLLQHKTHRQRQLYRQMAEALWHYRQRLSALDHRQYGLVEQLMPGAVQQAITRDPSVGFQSELQGGSALLLTPPRLPRVGFVALKPALHRSQIFRLGTGLSFSALGAIGYTVAHTLARSRLRGLFRVGVVIRCHLLFADIIFLTRQLERCRRGRYHELGLNSGLELRLSLWLRPEFRSRCGFRLNFGNRTHIGLARCAGDWLESNLNAANVRPRWLDLRFKPPQYQPDQRRMQRQ